MKNLLVVLALLVGGAISAHAAADTTFDGPVRSPEPAQKIVVAKSSVTIQGISVSSAPTTNVIVDITQMYSQVCVQNFDTSSFLACSENISVSTLTANALIGTIIAPAASATAPATPTCFPVIPGRPFYCRTASVSASTRAGTTRVR